MPSISKNDKTITWSCQADDEAIVRVGLQELLGANPGYTPVLIVEDAAGNATTHTNLTASTPQGSTLEDDIAKVAEEDAANAEATGDWRAC